MSDKSKPPIRVLVADDEAEVRDAYRQILTEADMSGDTAVFHNLRERLFAKNAPERAAKKLMPAGDTTFAPVFCGGRRRLSQPCELRWRRKIPLPWLFWT